MKLVAGVDGVTGGWVMAVAGPSRGAPVEFSSWRSFGDLWAEACVQDIAVVAVPRQADTRRVIVASSRDLTRREV